MHKSKIFHGLLILTLLFVYTFANPRPDDDDDNGGGSVNTADSDESANAKCISSGDFFDPVNLLTDIVVNSGGDRKNNGSTSGSINGTDENDGVYQSGQNQNGSVTWRKLSVNRYYGVRRDRFYVRNIEGIIHIQLRDGDPFSKASIFGAEDDWRHEYIFARANLFYSQSKGHGAMHSIKGKTYALEIQYVHYKKSFASLEEATKEKHGVLVLCIMFIGSGKETTYMDPVVAASIMNIFPSDKFHVAHGPLELLALLPNDVTNLQYTGQSLVPPCAREAKFVVLASPRMVSEKQLAKLRLVRDHSGGKNIGIFGKYEKSKSKDSIKTTTSANIKLSIEKYEVLAGISLKASILVVLLLSFGSLWFITISL